MKVEYTKVYSIGCPITYQQRFLGNILRHTDGRRNDSNDLAFEVVFKKKSNIATRVALDGVQTKNPGGNGRTMPPIIQAANASSLSGYIGRRSLSALSIYGLKAMGTSTALRSFGPLGVRCWRGAVVDGIGSIAEAVKFGSIISFAGSIRYIKCMRATRIDTAVQAEDHRCERKPTSHRRTRAMNVLPLHMRIWDRRRGSIA